MELFFSWLVLTASIWLTAWLLPGFQINGLVGAAWIAVLLGALHLLVGWLLFVVIGVSTLGLGFVLAFATRLVVTAILLCVIDLFSQSLQIEGFGWALLGALIMSVLGSLGELVIRALT